jgi:hypothetical protein
LAAANRTFTVREETTEDAALAVKLLRSRNRIVMSMSASFST